jgi:RNA polymerase sigma-70 factor (ECF subfamily)
MSVVEHAVASRDSRELEVVLDTQRRPLTGYCYRMLGSPFDAEDAVQETMLRAWRAWDGFHGDSAVRTWLYRIATNVCLDSLAGRKRRALPFDMGPASPPDPSLLNTRPDETWLEPIPDSMLGIDASDPAEVTVARETVRLAFVAALQHLPPRQRAALILCEVLRWQATEAAELLQTSVASVNSALQRARARLAETQPGEPARPDALDRDQRQLLERYVSAFERYDMSALTELIQEDAVQSMPPFDMWLAGRENIFSWWWGPGIGCRDSRVLPVGTANGAAAFGQYKPSETGSGREPWALQVIELGTGGIAKLTFFLNTGPLFKLFGLPPRLD